MTTYYTIDMLLKAGRHLPGFACFDTEAGSTFMTWSQHPPFTALHGWENFVRRSIRSTSSREGGFSGGVVGWLGYEAGQTVEAMPKPDGQRPTHDVCLWRVDGSLEIDEVTGKVFIHGDDTFRAQAKDLLDLAVRQDTPTFSDSEASGWKPSNHIERSHHYTKSVRKILDHVHAGDVYQVNLAWEQTAIPIDDAISAWLNLRSYNPAARGCYLRQGGVEIVSNSPELFLSVDGENRTVQSIPIKGTAPFSGGDDARNDLELSPKERAELTMIVDLVRNDLGRVAIPGSVCTEPREIRQCGDLWHAEQRVKATLSLNKDAISAVMAAFPPGSVTGAPKVRAMEVIHHLEDTPRGIYTGAIGWFADGGSAHLNVAIRTATVVDGFARFHVGAGIVAESHPEDEWVETLAKARALAHSLGAGT